ncbi:MAG: GIY-YIG nuclease family protein [Candidatus Berkelbacteria bacterium]|nr:GIY-YIG nuclease family protein [Candidatus Berkelbacteria bacterium]
MYYVYIIENIIDKSWYIGFSTDVDRRLLEHNTKSGGKFTRQKSGQWRLIYTEGYQNKMDALGREKFLKSGSGRRFIRKQIKNYLSK